MLAVEVSGLNSSFQGLKFVWLWGKPPMKGMVKKEKEFWSSAQRGNFVWVTHILSTEVCVSTQEWQGAKTVWILKA